MIHKISIVEIIIIFICLLHKKDPSIYLLFRKVVNYKSKYVKWDIHISNDKFRNRHIQCWFKMFSIVFWHNWTYKMTVFLLIFSFHFLKNLELCSVEHVGPFKNADILIQLFLLTFISITTGSPTDQDEAENILGG